MRRVRYVFLFFFFQAEDGIRDKLVTGVQTCALPICRDERGEIILSRRTSARCQILCASLRKKCFTLSRKTSARCKQWVYCTTNSDQSEIDRKFLIGAKNSGEAGLLNKSKYNRLVQRLNALAQFQ